MCLMKMKRKRESPEMAVTPMSHLPSLAVTSFSLSVTLLNHIASLSLSLSPPCPPFIRLMRNILRKLRWVDHVLSR